MSVDTGAVLGAFAESFGRPAEVLSVAPGRVNLIGEHTDYNGGFVLPVAIDRTIAVAAAARDDRGVAVRSLDFDEQDEFPLDGIERSADWRNYVRGVAWALADAGHGLRGADLIVSGDVPQGAGLSSSAAIELAVAGAMCAVARNDLGARDLALIAQKAENAFVGVQCGIMDQFASALSQAGQALLIDCRSLDIEHIPLPLDEAGVAVVIVDSKVPRRLEAAPYNERRRECEDAAAALAVSSLRDADSAMLETRRVDLGPCLYKRARHVVSENARVLRAVEAIRAGDVDRVGELMYESHESLRDDFEVSCAELDALVELASRSPGVLGARLTGAGFGGCTVNLVRIDAIDMFRKCVVDEYPDKTGLPAEMHVCRAVDGLRVSHV